MLQKSILKKKKKATVRNWRNQDQSWSQKCWNWTALPIHNPCLLYSWA